MQQLGIYLDAATEYLEALRLAKGDKRDAALDTLRSMSERPAPFAEAAGALIDGLGVRVARHAGENDESLQSKQQQCSKTITQYLQQAEARIH